MTLPQTLAASVVAAAVVLGGAALLTPIVFADRLPAGLTVGSRRLAGLPAWHLAAGLALVEQDITQRTVRLTLRGHTVQRTLEELGVSLDMTRTQQAVRSRMHASLASLLPQRITPQVAIDAAQLQERLREDFAGLIALPQNAALAVSGGQATLIPGQAGEAVNVQQLAAQLADKAAADQPIELAVAPSPPAIADEAALALKPYIDQLLREGLILAHPDGEMVIKPFTLERLLTFTPGADAGGGRLIAQLNREQFAEYITTTVSPEIERPPQDARFEMVDGKVAQFALPQAGRTIDLDATIRHANAALTAGQTRFALVIAETQPAVADAAGIEALGITQLLAVGESDFAGSPKNRKHNIAVGADRYHGVLLPPGAEFSFNELLGPVTAAAGFKPELVIKNNVTTPEYGGGLCQVSTTVFRAALNAGLEITARRNHSYAVRYYGTPGLDATIYPPYTDLRFKNNTPGYILIQRRLEGTRLAFEFWGTSDGREVEIIGPHVYDRQPDGAVKAALTQKVVKDGQAMIDETFYSRYRSPKLFPTVVAANRG
ncbi:MAG: hypothetical protein COT71_01625 [Candidatus Andersenbacteria bacterium CG10_big_fil_rev_8_21_14_0_10_54_11]|uniref:YoaR-like putative peptidoglycan binding domain-containing protein n=1 Tax=Candidatus Andersenbacteria bacterium CG10_big_fil_rev_8_21_14_0_10_54_11 TaxID=1974485 RepID=A0A2M6WZU6_9BACT|nr:MAG: hypothetical protein COT71_01625 [Candidatus Andersenbacteria bacterium CG10_big_fil_rev_8_21_14_0_10_54_11]